MFFTMQYQVFNQDLIHLNKQAHAAQKNKPKKNVYYLVCRIPRQFQVCVQKRPGMLRLQDGSLLFRCSFLKYLGIASRIVDSQLARDLNETPTRVSFSFPCSLSFPWLSVLPQFRIVSEHGPVSSGFVQENKTQEAQFGRRKRAICGQNSTTVMAALGTQRNSHSHWRGHGWRRYKRSLLLVRPEG